MIMKKKEDPNPGRWLTVEDFNRINSKHFEDAVHALVAGEEDHPFGESTDYDVLLENGKRLAPKAVLGIAARRALNLDNVQPSHFRGGEGTPCFKTIRRLGYLIVPKGGDGKVPLDPDQSKWIEGDPVRESHLRYERNPKAVREKKDIMLKEYGRLICEECKFDPVEYYRKQSGNACIEVHHTVPLAEVGRRETSIEDLMCVCANCHRVLHHEMRLTKA